MKPFHRIHIACILFLPVSVLFSLCFGQDLVEAAREGSVERVRVLLASGVDINAKDKNGETALHRAANKGYSQVVELLIANGADVNVRSNWGGTPLYEAAIEGRKEVAELLISAGADVNAKDEECYTPLHGAGYGGSGPVAEILIANGADVNARTDSSQNAETPLHVAAHSSTLKVAEVLIVKGADVNSKDELGRTCLHIAHGEKMIELLVAKGADVSAKDKDGRTPLHFPYGKAEGLLVLVANGSNVNAEDNQSRTPLHMVDDMSVREAELLISEGANVNAENKKGRTPLHVAAFKGCEKVAKLLIAGGASVNVKDKDGLTALDYASKSGHKELVETLLIPVTAAKFAEKDENTFWLRYKPTRNLYYYVERTFSHIENNDKENTERIHQRAIIKYGKFSVLSTGVIRFTPEAHLLSKEGKGDHIQSDILPVETRFPTGMWTDDWRWKVAIMARDHDMFPVFPEKSVKVGDSWQIDGRFSYPGLKGRIDRKIKHTLETIEAVNGANCAKIKYSLSYNFDTGKHPETWAAGEFTKFTKPVYTAKVEGTAYFDIEKGVVVKQEHHAENIYRWSGKFDEEFAKRYPNLPESGERVTLSKITAELVSKEQASRLIEAAEAARAKAEAARAKAEAAKPVEPVEETGPRWKYFVERKSTERDNLVKKNRERIRVSRAFAHFGAGAKYAGGQIETVPNVVYVDENKEPLPEHRGPAIVPSDSQKYTLISKWPEDVGFDPDIPMPVLLFFEVFFLPMGPEEELKKGLTWNRTLNVYYGETDEFTFPVEIKHRMTGYKQKKGRKCAVIKYTIAGKFKAADHPERFTQEQLRHERGELGLKGRGTAYFDEAEGIIVEKSQATSFTVYGGRLVSPRPGEVVWTPIRDQKHSVEIRVSLLPEGYTDEEAAEPGLSAVSYVLITGAVGIITAGVILLLRKRQIAIKNSVE